MLQPCGDALCVRECVCRGGLTQECREGPVWFKLRVQGSCVFHFLSKQIEFGTTM